MVYLGPLKKLICVTEGEIVVAHDRLPYPAPGTVTPPVVFSPKIIVLGSLGGGHRVHL